MLPCELLCGVFFLVRHYLRLFVAKGARERAEADASWGAVDDRDVGAGADFIRRGLPHCSIIELAVVMQCTPCKSPSFIWHWPKC